MWRYDVNGKQSRQAPTCIGLDGLENIFKKWSSRSTNLKNVDIVLICDKNLKQWHWPLGCIVETLPGPGNVVRVVKVQKKDSSYLRSVASLALLECSNDRVGVVWCVIVPCNSSLVWECFLICARVFLTVLRVKKFLENDLNIRLIERGRYFLNFEMSSL